MSDLYNDPYSQDVFDADPTKPRKTTWATGTYNSEPSWSGEQDELAVSDYIKDIFIAPVRGAEGFVQGLYGLADMATMDALPDYTNDDRLFGNSKTLAGGLVEGLTQFMIPFSALGWAGKAGKLGQFGRWIGKDTIASELVRGGIVDFAAFEGSAGRLSDVVKGTALENPVTQYLSSDIDDSELEGRVKNLVEGGIIGVPIDLVLNSIKTTRRYKEARERGATTSEAAYYAAGILEDKVDGWINARMNEDVASRRQILGLEIPNDAVPPTVDDAGPVNQVEWSTKVNDLFRNTKVLYGLEGADREAVQTFVGKVGVRLFDDVTINWKNAEGPAAGSFDYASKTVSLYSDALVSGQIPKTIVHELWHSLEDTLEPSEVLAIKKQFLKERQAYFASNPAARQRFDALTGNPTSDVLDKAINDIVANGEYQYVSPAEWWAAKATDVSVDRLEKLSKIENGGVRGLLTQAQKIWSDFWNALRQKFGFKTADSIVSSYFSGQRQNAKRSVQRLQYLNNAYGLSTAYSRVPKGILPDEAAAIEAALAAAKEQKLSGLDAAVLVPYSTRINGPSWSGAGFNEFPIHGKGTNAVNVSTEAGVRGANIIYALANLSAPGKSDEAKKLALEYLRTIGVDVTKTKDAEELLNSIVSQKRFEVKELLGAKPEGPKSAQAATVEGAEALTETTTSGEKAAGEAAAARRSSAEIKADIEKADAQITSGPGTPEEKLQLKIVSRLQIGQTKRVVTNWLIKSGLNEATAKKLVKKAESVLDVDKAAGANRKGGVGVSRQQYSVKGVNLDLDQKTVDRVLALLSFGEAKMSIPSVRKIDVVAGTPTAGGKKPQAAAAASTAQTAPSTGKNYPSEVFDEDMSREISNVIIRVAKDPEFRATTPFEREVQRQFGDVIDEVATSEEFEFGDVFRKIDDLLVTTEGQTPQFQRIAASREAVAGKAGDVQARVEPEPTAEKAPTEAPPEEEFFAIEETDPLLANEFPSTQTDILSSDVRPEVTEFDRVDEARAGQEAEAQIEPTEAPVSPQEAGVPEQTRGPEVAQETVNPPSKPPEPPSPPSAPSGAGEGGGRQRRSPEEIGEDPRPLTREDAQDLIDWAFDRPQEDPATGAPIEGINPRDLTPAQLLANWLEKRQLNFGRLVLDRTEGSFLRTLEEYAVARMQATDPISSLDDYSPAKMAKDGLETLAKAGSVSVWQFARDLKVHARTIEDARGKLFIGRVLMLTMNKEVTSDLLKLKAAFDSGNTSAISDGDLVMILGKIEVLGEMISAVRGVSTGAGRLLHSLRSRARASRVKNLIDYSKPTEASPSTNAAAPATPVRTPSPSPAGSPSPTAPAGNINTAGQNLPKATGSPVIGITPNDLVILEQVKKAGVGPDLEEVINQMGGRKKVYDTVQKLHEVVQKHLGEGGEVPEHILAKVGADARTVGFWDFHNEYWINMLVSSSTTFLGVNLISSMITTTLIPLERMMGAAVMADKTAFAEGLNTYKAAFSSLTSSLGAAVESFKTESPVGVGRRVDNMKHRAFSRQNLPFINKLSDRFHSGSDISTATGSRTATQAGFDWLFGAINMPMRLIQTGDEFFKQVNYRSTLEAKLRTSLSKQGLPSSEIDRRISDLMNTAILNNEFVTNERLLREGMERGRQTLGSGATVADLEAFAKSYRDTEWVKAGALDPNFADIAERSMNTAKEATLQSDPRFGLQSGITNLVTRHPALRLFLPFVSTPINALVFAGDRLALPSHVIQFAKYASGKRIAHLSENAGMPAFVANWAKNEESRFMQDMLSTDPSARAELVGRALFGTAMFGAVYTMAANGVINGFGPSNREEKKTWLDRGNRPYSIKVGDKVYSFSRLDPLSTMMGSIADLALATKYSRNDPEAVEMLSAVSSSLFFSMTNNLTNKSYLQGLKTLVDMVGSNDPELFAKWASRQAGTYVPYSSMSQTIVNLTDENRRIPDADLWDGIRTSITNKIPGMSDEGLVARDMFGKPLRRDEVFGPDFMSPITVSRLKNDPVSREMIKLERAFSVPSRRHDGIDLSLLKLENGRNAYDKFQEMTGNIEIGGKTLEQALTDLVSSDRYKKLSPESTDFVDSPRVYAIRSVFAKYRTRAYKQLKSESEVLRTLTQEINTQEREAKLGIAPGILKPY